MLYKKYHRSYIRQFKKGIKIIIGCEYGEVIEEPSIDKDINTGICSIIFRIDAVPTCIEDAGYRTIMIPSGDHGKLHNEWIKFV